MVAKMTKIIRTFSLCSAHSSRSRGRFFLIRLKLWTNILPKTFDVRARHWFRKKRKKYNMNDNCYNWITLVSIKGKTLKQTAVFFFGMQTTNWKVDFNLPDWKMTRKTSKCDKKTSISAICIVANFAFSRVVCVDKPPPRKRRISKNLITINSKTSFISFQNLHCKFSLPFTEVAKSTHFWTT